MTTTKLPKKLYKYKAYNVHTLRLLSEAEVYYANPTSFNDPLDCKPTIQVDIDITLLEKLCLRMLKNYRGKDYAVKIINYHRYMSTEFGNYKIDSKAEDYYIHSLANNIKDLLYSELQSHGVLSMAERWDCPLMWSHYADEHRGLCIEYDTNENIFTDLRAVAYNQPRRIKLSDLFAWKINTSTQAESDIRNIFFYAKAKQWKYEREWRDVTKSIGPCSAPIRVSAVYFGLRCDPALLTSIVKLYTNSDINIKFYDLFPFEDSFQLKRRLLKADEIEECSVKSSAALDYKDIFIDESQA